MGTRKPFPVVRGFRAVSKALLIHHWSVAVATSKSKAAMLVRWFRHHLWVGYLSRIISSLKTRHSILSNIEDKYNSPFTNPPTVWQFGIQVGDIPMQQQQQQQQLSSFLPSFLACLLTCWLTYFYTTTTTFCLSPFDTNPCDKLALS